MICSVVRKRVVTVQQEVEPGGFLQLFNRSTSGRERASCDHGTVICQQNSVMLMRNSSHCLSELLVASNITNSIFITITITLPNPHPTELHNLNADDNSPAFPL